MATDWEVAERLDHTVFAEFAGTGCRITDKRHTSQQTKQTTQKTDFIKLPVLRIVGDDGENRNKEDRLTRLRRFAHAQGLSCHTPFGRGAPA